MTIADIIEDVEENGVSAQISISVSNKRIYTLITNDEKGNRHSLGFTMTFEEIEESKFDIYSKKFTEAVKGLKER